MLLRDGSARLGEAHDDPALHAHARGHAAADARARPAQRASGTALDDERRRRAARDGVIPEATELARRVAEKLGGVPLSLVTETLLGIPTTAHILGGCCMGDSRRDRRHRRAHRVFGYDGLYVIDGSAVSANPGVNPSLTITALAERAMTFIPEKGAAERAA